MCKFLILLMTLWMPFYGYAASDIGQTFIKRGGGPKELTTQQYLSIVEAFLPSNPHVLEAGAHGGEDTILLAQKWPQGKVFSFEPVPLFFKRTRKNVKTHNVSNVELFPFGLFNITGKHKFYLSQNCGGASSYLPEGETGTDYEDIEIILPCITLDDWATTYKIDHIDFMWLDMEGAERQALEHATKILQRTKVILTELNFKQFRCGTTQYEDLKGFLEKQGFVLHMIWGSAHRQATGLFIQRNLL